MYHVKVQQKHINKGQILDGCNCPVARAVKQAWHIPIDNRELDDQYVSVDGDTVEVWSNGLLIVEYECSKKMRKFIKSFDEGKKVSPVDFYLREIGT